MLSKISSTFQEITCVFDLPVYLSVCFCDKCFSRMWTKFNMLVVVDTVSCQKRVTFGGPRPWEPYPPLPGETFDLKLLQQLKISQ